MGLPFFNNASRGKILTLREEYGGRIEGRNILVLQLGDLDVSPGSDINGFVNGLPLIYAIVLNSKMKDWVWYFQGSF